MYVYIYIYIHKLVSICMSVCMYLRMYVFLLPASEICSQLKSRTSKMCDNEDASQGPQGSLCHDGRSMYLCTCVRTYVYILYIYIPVHIHVHIHIMYIYTQRHIDRQLNERMND